MLNLSDKDLDRLSREAADQFEPDEQGSSWDKLSAILDREIGKEPPVSVTRYRVSPYIFGGMIVLLIGAGFFLFRAVQHQGSSVTEPNSRTTVASDARNKPGNVAASSGTRANQRAGNPAGDASHATERKQPVVLGQGAAGVPAGISSQNKSTSGKPGAISEPGSVPAGQAARDVQSAGGPVSDVASSRNNTVQNENRDRNNLNSKSGHHAGAKATVLAGSASVVAARDGNSIQNGKTRGNNTQVTGQENDPASKKGNQASSGAGAYPQARDQLGNPFSGPLNYAILPAVSSVDNSSPDILLNDSALRKYNAKGNLPTEDAVDKAHKNSRTAYVNRALKIGLVAGPDYTDVNKADNNKFSTNVGLTVGYEVFKHWSVNTGFIYTKKNYSANGQDFHSKPGYMAYDSLLFVKGNCAMFEIPLSIRYDFSAGKKTSFFVNGGLSSYLMSSENYQYFYIDTSWPTRVPWRSNWIAYHNPKNYLFAVASLSAGIEEQLGKGFSLQAEPFAKIPLKGVGIGSLELSSYGIYFSLRYAPVLKRKRQ